MSPPQVHHLYECLHKDIPYNPAKIDQFTQIHEPDLPEFLYHIDEDEDPVPCFAMTNHIRPYSHMILPELQAIKVVFIIYEEVLVPYYSCIV